MHTPTVTVLMPVYNGEAFLQMAVESILRQTFTDFEFLIVDDGSTDDSRGIVRSFRDPRIRLETVEKNRGTVHALNTGIGLSRGKYIARMDCDDVSLPYRLDRQVGFMEKHPGVGVCGSGMRLVKKGKPKNFRYQPCFDEELKITLLFNTCFFHPTVIMRRSVVENALYPDNLVYTQDYNFWTRLAGTTGFANLSEPLIYFREHPGQVSAQKATMQKTNARSIRRSYLHVLFTGLPSEDQEIHHKIAENSRTIDLLQAAAWLELLVDLNRRERVFPSEIFLREMSRKWWLCCRKNTHYGKETLDIYRSSSLYGHYRPKAFKLLKFYGRSLVAGQRNRLD